MLHHARIQNPELEPKKRGKSVPIMVARAIKSAAALALTLPIVACNYKGGRYDAGAPPDAGTGDAGDAGDSDGGEADGG